MSLPSFSRLFSDRGRGGHSFHLSSAGMDSELFVMKALGFSPLRLARPALIWLLGWDLAVCGDGVDCSTSKASAILMRPSQPMSSLIFREVFYPRGDGLTLYIRDRDYEGNLLGLGDP